MLSRAYAVMARTITMPTVPVLTHESEVTADKHGKLKVIWENARQ